MEQGLGYFYHSKGVSIYKRDWQMARKQWRRDELKGNWSGLENLEGRVLLSATLFELAPYSLSLGGTDVAAIEVADSGTGGTASATASSNGLFDIVINAGAGLAGNGAALDAFNRAAAQWEVFFTDAVTINIDADLVNLGSPNTIGQTGSVMLTAGYDVIRDEVVNDAADESDDGIVAALPTASQVKWSFPGGFKWDGGLVATKANLKALGFADLDTQFGATDATIEFNSQFSFDYDNSDGVGAGMMDFETVAAHEIGHALGFVSEVDTVDYYKSVRVRPRISPATLDLFRFEEGTSHDPSTTSQFTSFARSLKPNVAANTDAITGWGTASAENRMSTGFYTGDGRQASHWQDGDISGNIIGNLDPTLALGQVIAISDADVRALDLIGYDIDIVVGNQPPTADAGSNQNVTTGDVVQLDASGSSDPENDPLTYSWVITSAPAGSTATLSNTSVVNPTFTADLDGTYVVELVVNDGEFNSTVDSVTITASPVVTGGSHVGDIDGQSKVKGRGRKWEALATVTVHDSNDNSIASATVHGTWSGDANGSVSGVTDSNGRITFSTGNMTSGTNAIFTVTNITGAGTYNSGANHDPDGDSSGTAININKSGATSPASTPAWMGALGFDYAQSSGLVSIFDLIWSDADDDDDD